MNQPTPEFKDNATEEGDIEPVDGSYPIARARKFESRRIGRLLPLPHSGAGKDNDRSIDRHRVLLSSPETLPLRDLTHISRQRVVIVAPHPDDETLGCGGAIALLCAKGYDVKVAIVSDGTMSHPNSRSYPAPALRSLRERETLAALAILGIEDRSLVTFLGLKDGAVPTITSPNFQAAKVLCQDYLKQTLPDTIFLPWRADPHPDHRATWQLIQAAILSLGISPQIIEYPIWDWDLQQQKKLPDLDRISGWRLNIDKVLAQKRHAIAAYKSQLGLAIDDDPDGFYLTPEMLTNFTRSWEVYFEEI
ncbi:PIG-L deacetylase family protein [Chamaesiphon polymorphus]|uniref:PIG-L domain-containing protein n=1 Tax=Chamaesiphon polymorphus CCALA 037 TaxID=2107692 RepID=A0A2T1GAK6_9CYAN|nr:PIG-L family deacetylase [Chamaesiphon polymorphus]PSB54213.1 PIG-L domain-containing protein [Chamaesiphon polymorphus CCALA 037]